MYDNEGMESGSTSATAYVQLDEDSFMVNKIAYRYWTEQNKLTKGLLPAKMDSLTNRWHGVVGVSGLIEEIR